MAESPAKKATINRGWQEGDDGDHGVDKAVAARIAVSPTRTMEQRGMGDGGNKEEVNDHAIGKVMTATATAADGRPFLGATAGKIGRAYC